MVNIPLFTGFHTCQVGFLKHQQYVKEMARYRLPPFLWKKHNQDLMLHFKCQYAVFFSGDLSMYKYLEFLDEICGMKKTEVMVTTPFSFEFLF